MGAWRRCGPRQVGDASMDRRAGPGVAAFAGVPASARAHHIVLSHGVRYVNRQHLP